MAKYEKVDIRQLASGRHRGLLIAAGVDESVLNGKHQPCPINGCSGKDRFRYDNKNNTGTYFCNQCGAGDWVNLLMNQLNCDFIGALDFVKSNLGIVKMDTPNPAKTKYEANKKRLDKTKTGFQKLSYDNPAGKYLKNRGINIFPDGSLFYHPAVEYWEGSTLIGLFPAMVGEIKNNATDRVTYQITYLTVNGEKADVPTKKKNMPIERENIGACVRLFRFTDTLAVAEGKEKSIKFTEDTGIPCWSTEGSAGMVKWEVPKEVKKLIIVSDGDFVGKQAAYTLAVRAMRTALVNVVFIFNDTYITDKGEKVDYLDYANRIKSCTAE